MIYFWFGLWWFLTYACMREVGMMPKESQEQLRSLPFADDALYFIAAPLVPIILPVMGLVLMVRRWFT